MDSENRDRASTYRFGRLIARFAAGQSDECDCPAFARPLAREQDCILAHRSKIRRKPVANVNKPLHHRIASSGAALIRSTVIIAPCGGLQASTRPLILAAPRQRFARY